MSRRVGSRARLKAARKKKKSANKPTKPLARRGSM